MRMHLKYNITQMIVVKHVLKGECSLGKNLFFIDY